MTRSQSVTITLISGGDAAGIVDEPDRFHDEVTWRKDDAIMTDPDANHRLPAVNS